MNIVGPPLGKISLVPDTFEEWNTNQAVAIFRPIDGLDRRYLVQTLMTRSILDWAVQRSKATAGQFNLTLEVCRDLPLPLAPEAEQLRIAEATGRAISVFAHMEAVAQVQHNRAGSLRSSILSSAFAGQLAPQDSTDEPAAALLARIRAERSASSKPSPTRRTRKPSAHAS